MDGRSREKCVFIRRESAGISANRPGKAGFEGNEQVEQHVMCLFFCGMQVRSVPNKPNKPINEATGTTRAAKLERPTRGRRKDELHAT